MVCGGIHMSDIPSSRMSMLREERAVVSVANLTRADGHQFLDGTPNSPRVRTQVSVYPLSQANRAIDDLRHRPPARRGGARAIRRRTRDEKPSTPVIAFRFPTLHKAGAYAAPSCLAMPSDSKLPVAPRHEIVGRRAIKQECKST